MLVLGDGKGEHGWLVWRVAVAVVVVVSMSSSMMWGEGCLANVLHPYINLKDNSTRTLTSFSKSNQHPCIPYGSKKYLPSTLTHLGHTWPTIQVVSPRLLLWGECISECRAAWLIECVVGLTSCLYTLRDVPPPCLPHNDTKLHHIIKDTALVWLDILPAKWIIKTPHPPSHYILMITENRIKGGRKIIRK